MKLRIGNSLKSKLPAKGAVRMFRAGSRNLTSYEYDTLPLNTIEGHSDYPQSEHYIVDEVARFFSRAGHGDASPWSDRPNFSLTDPRMTTGADMFAIMDDGDIDYWCRRGGDYLTGEVENIRNHGENTDQNETIGMVFRAFKNIEGGIETWKDAADAGLTWKTGQEFNWYGQRMDDGSSHEAWFDNAQVKLSNILYEFSPDDGEDKWYQLYDLPNRAYTRVNLPQSTNRLKIRAMSNNPEEWVQSFVFTPKPDKQNVPNKRDIATAPIEIVSVDEDEFGRLSWQVNGGNQNIMVYEVAIETAFGVDTYVTKDKHIDNINFDDVIAVSIYARDITQEAETSISDIKIYPADDIYPSEDLYPRR